MTLRIELDERTTDELAQLARGKEIAPADLAKEPFARTCAKRRAAP
jgi:hypothetical protein